MNSKANDGQDFGFACQICGGRESAHRLHRETQVVRAEQGASAFSVPNRWPPLQGDLRSGHEGRGATSHLTTAPRLGRIRRIRGKRRRPSS